MAGFDFAAIINAMARKMATPKKKPTKPGGLNIFAPSAAGSSAASNAGGSMRSLPTGNSKISYGYSPYTNNAPSVSGGGGTFGGVPSISGGGGTFQTQPGGVGNDIGNHSSSFLSGLLGSNGKQGGQSYNPGKTIGGAATSLLGGLFGANPGLASNNTSIPGGSHGDIAPDLGNSGGGGAGGYNYQPQTITTPDLHFQQPDFKLRDFTDKANQMAASSYGPQYQQIDMASKGAQDQYKRSDTITAGLYANLAKEIAQAAASTKKEYAGQNAQIDQQTQGLTGDINAAYANSGKQQGDLMQSLGIQAAAPAALGNMAADNAWNQSQAMEANQAQKAALNVQGQGQTDYLRGIGNANQTQGTVSREGLLNDLSNILGQYDQQKVGLKGDERSTAQSIADNLQSKDFDLQKANYGGYKDSYDAQVHSADQATQLALQQAQMNMQNAQFGAGFNQTAAQQQIDNAYRDAQAKIDQANKDRGFGLDQSKYQTDAELAAQQLQLDANKQSGANGPPPIASADSKDPQGRVLYAALQATGGDAGQAQTYTAALDQWVRTLQASNKSLNDYAGPGGIVHFTNEAATDLAKFGLDPGTASRVAAAWYNEMMTGTAQKAPATP